MGFDEIMIFFQVLFTYLIKKSSTRSTECGANRLIYI